ncbi:hypothetical protein [Sphingobacterium zeae]|uniref:hypothetical protein n=1 Tax=Sphingobacterium zeae TaxID=1776859 RepID=UPI00361B440C
MDFLLQIKNWLIRILVVLIGFLFFTVYSVSVSANSINCEHEYHSCPSVDLKISEKSHPSTSQNLKNVVPVIHFSCKSESNLLVYRNCGKRVDANAAKTGTTALRKVGSVLERVDDVLTNPILLQGQSYGYVRNMLGKSEGWVNSVMTKTRGADKGWVLRQVNSRGQETGRLIQYHPGSRRHFGGAPYWKVSDGANTFRFPAAN